MDTTNGMLIVERIDFLLSQLNQTRVDLCKSVDVTTQTISHWYTRGTVPSADVALKIADYLNVSLEYLLYGTEKTLSNEERALLSDYKDLSPEQKTTVTTLISTFEKLNQEKKCLTTN